MNQSQQVDGTQPPQDQGAEARHGYAVFVQFVGEATPQWQVDLSLGQVVSQIVIPWESREAFMVAGRSVSGPSGVATLRIYCAKSEWMGANLNKLFRHVGRGKTEIRTEEELALRVRAIMEAHGRDVTAELTTAYQETIAQRLEEWVSRKPQLLRALRLALEALGG